MTEREIIMLVDAKAFTRAWFLMLPQHKTYEEAYEALEEQYISVFKRRRYKSYESFRQIRLRIGNI